MSTTTPIVRRLLAAIAAVSMAVGLALLTAPPASAATPKVTWGNLLRARDFTTHGFAKADTLNAWEGPGVVETPECGAQPAYLARGYRNQRQRMFIGRQTEAEELVLQFTTTAHAKAYVLRYRRDLSSCEKRLGRCNWRSSSTKHPKISASEAAWWKVHNTLYDPEHRAVAVVRQGKRVALLELRSSTSEPWQTTDVVALMRIAARRL